MSEISLQSVSKRFDSAQAVDGLSLTVHDGEFVVLLGPTGVGKTTTLRLTAGLEHPDAGRVFIAGHDVTDRSPAERDVCFVFQQYSLYPHYTVFENLVFPLRAPQRDIAEAEIRRRVHEVAELLHITGKLNNPATALSGGEMQRVGLGRALVRDPNVFLMDEPLSSLDAKLREDLRLELKRIQRDRSATILYAAHDQLEALTLADRVAVLDEGRILQLGTPREIYERPNCVAVAQRLGSPTVNVIPASLLPQPDAPAGTSTLGIRPEDLRFGNDRGPEARVLTVEHLGPQTVVLLELRGHTLHAEVGAHETIHPGATVRLAARPGTAVFFDEGGARIESPSSTTPAATPQPEARPVKRFFNDKDMIVTEALDGLAALSGNRIAVLEGYPHVKVALRAEPDPATVSVISGGGAGHEPAHAGFVGDGMLTAAISGELFASPSVEAIVHGIRAVTSSPGCLAIVKNYTGDRLNFGLAAVRAQRLGLAVETVLVADDIAIPGAPQPRGVAGTLFVHKIAGHLADQGEPLARVAEEARAAAADIWSLGVSLDTCTIPGQPRTERLGPSEAELGLGIHGEPGVEVIEMQSAAAIVAVMSERLEAALPVGDHRYAAILNNLGAVPAIEMSLIAREVLSSSIGQRIDLVIGPAPLMTSLDMNGFSISLLRLTALRREALMSSCAPSAWPPAIEPRPIERRALPERPPREVAPPSSDPKVRAGLTAMMQRMVTMEDELNQLDARVGDGDTGSTIARAARAVLELEASLPYAEPDKLLARLGDTFAEQMGGSSGVLASIFCQRAGLAYDTASGWTPAMNAGLSSVQHHGGARVGDRTMVDALAPALEALTTGGSLSDAVDAAHVGVASTAALRRARAGRASYLGEEALKDVPDPGAVAVAAMLEALRDAVHRVGDR